MRALMMAAAMAAFFVSYVEPAFAACAGEVQWAERRLQEIRDRGYRSMAAEQLRLAREAAARGGEAGCQDRVRSFDLYARYDDVQHNR